MKPGNETTEFFMTKLTHLVTVLTTIAGWLAMFADNLSENGAVIITAAMAILSAVSQGTYNVSRGITKSGS